MQQAALLKPSMSGAGSHMEGRSTGNLTSVGHLGFDNERKVGYKCNLKKQQAPYSALL